MTPEKSEELYRRYPRIFAQKSRGEHGGFWGFECRDGWFDLIDRLCTKIKAEGSPIEAAQVKEKFGGLRFYYDWIAEENDHEVGDEIELAMKIRGLVHQAEEESFTICEVCGEPGELRHLRWIQTLCDKHTEEYSAKLETDERKRVLASQGINLEQKDPLPRDQLRVRVRPSDYEERLCAWETESEELRQACDNLETQLGEARFEAQRWRDSVIKESGLNVLDYLLPWEKREDDAKLENK